MNKTSKKLSFLASVIGPISPPPFVGEYPDNAGGLFVFLNVVLMMLIYGAGIFVLFNLVFAGYGFISAGGNAEKIEQAWNKIWQSLLGLVIVAGSFIIAAVAGQILFRDPRALIVPRVVTP